MINGHGDKNVKIKAYPRYYVENPQRSLEFSEFSAIFGDFRK